MADVTLAFVHGFLSGPSTWDKFVRLVTSDPDLRDVATVERFTYETPYGRLSRLRRVPNLGDIASRFAVWLADSLAGRRVLIVSHSMGGLVVQRYLADIVRAGRAEELRKIAAIMMFACPNEGSEFAYLIRRSLPVWWWHPQERALRPLAEEVISGRQVVMERVVGARAPSSTAYPIPIWAYAGESDGVVLPQSAKSVFSERYCGTLPGDHFTIIQPDDHKHQSYVALKRRIEQAVRRAADSPDPALVSAEHTKAVVHYHRPDGDYAGWGLHVWGGGMHPRMYRDWEHPHQPDGRDEFGLYWHVPLTDPTCDVGFIVHRGSEKDPGPDQKFCPAHHPDAYVISGQVTVRWRSE